MPRPKLKDDERRTRRLTTHRKYGKKLVSICFHFNREDDRDVIEWLKAQPVMIDSIRSLIRSEMGHSHNK